MTQKNSTLEYKRWQWIPHLKERPLRALCQIWCSLHIKWLSVASTKAIPTTLLPQSVSDSCAWLSPARRQTQPVRCSLSVSPQQQLSHHRSPSPCDSLVPQSSRSASSTSFTFSASRQADSQSTASIVSAIDGPQGEIIKYPPILFYLIYVQVDIPYCLTGTPPFLF